MLESFNYKIENINDIDTPVLVVYPSIIERNIQHLIRLCGDLKQIRPHVKTHKCPQVVELLLKSGITKFKCATIAEAEMLASVGAADVLLAYQPVGPKIERFIKLMKTYPGCKFSCLIDNESTVQAMSDAAKDADVEISCFIDLNVGMDRTGVKPGEEAKQLVLYSSHLIGINLIGLHSYDGHLVDRDVSVRNNRAEEGYKSVLNFNNEMITMGFTSLRIVAGSTPTLSFYSSRPEVECCSGTFIYWDQHYRNSYPELPFEFAALVVTRVVSKPSLHSICLDLGYKAISSESALNERVNLIDLPDTEFLSQSEEHLLISTTNQLQISEVIYGVPYHIGRTCNLYESTAVVEQQNIGRYWNNIARSRKLSI